ncbi:hypothetical protein RFI_24107 [Reticulomyxa filosa]|uniref:Uncharacterized protein n=1 Tax=Reticulomyxa filosa TaxID=46433 RepID=X6MJN3_RETFI|nr:hypothetical protein RFI_24107 [Reticulomyxa filosa]|eukprot:ETO13270.1 hypothetical protein RFI_24107 [Reticulomyxa filosa]
MTMTKAQFLKVLREFEKALTQSKTTEELHSSWKELLRYSKAGNLYNKKRPRLSKYDKIIVDGFEIELDGVYRKKEMFQQAIRRAIRLKHATLERKPRQSLNQLVSSRSAQPAYIFAYDNNKNKKTGGYKTFWGKQLKTIKKQEKREGLNHWMTFPLLQKNSTTFETIDYYLFLKSNKMKAKYV